MKYQYIQVDEYTTVVLERDDEEEEAAPEELLTILDENEMRRIGENWRKKRKDVIYLR